MPSVKLNPDLLFSRIIRGGGAKKIVGELKGSEVETRMGRRRSPVAWGRILAKAV